MTKGKDRDTSENIYGVSANLLDTTQSICEKSDDKMAKIRGEKGAAIRDFDEQGGNKKALKFVQGMINMETDAAKDFWAAIHAYMHHFKVFHQHELFGDATAVEVAKSIPPQHTADEAIKAAKEAKEKANGGAIAEHMMAH